jgi:hypothetical protein
VPGSRTKLGLALPWLLAAACVQDPGAAEQGDDTDSTSEITSTSGSDSSETGTETGTEDEAWAPVAQFGTDTGALMSVWGASPSVLFVVGGQPEAGGGRVLRGHDDSWEAESLPAGVAMLNWVYGVDGSVWSVGLGGAIVRRGADGVWTTEASPTDRTLWGVWGASAGELWAVGGDGVSDDPVLLRRDPAGDWTLAELPELGVDAHALFKVWGTAADDVWIVGDAGAALHWDGVAWTAIPDPAGIDLISVWGSASEGVIAVGGRSNARVVRWVDGAWLGEVAGEPGLNGVWVDPEGGATLVGLQGSIHALAPGGFGLSPEPSGTSMVLHAVFGFAGGPRYAVGGSLLMAPPFVGVIVQDP